MATEPINIPIQTSYDDKGAKAALKDAQKLEDLDPTVEVGADVGEATDKIGDVEDAAKDVTGREWVAEVQADIGSSLGEIEGLQAKLRDAGDTADETSRHIDRLGKSEGPRLAGNQVADLTGPFGEASSAASDFGGVFDGLADISEKVAGRVGIDAAAMSSAIGGIGFVIAGAAAVWSIFSAKQEAAKKKAAEHLKLQTDLVKAIHDGNREVASSKFLELYGDIIEKGHKAGLSTNEVVDGIRGTGDAADTAARKLHDLDARIADVDKQYQDLHRTTASTGAVPSGEEKALATQLTGLKNARDALKGAHDQYADLNEVQAANVDLNGDVADALFGTTSKLDDTAAAAERAKQKADDLNTAFDDMQTAMDITRAAEDFATDMDAAMTKTQDGTALTRDEIRGIQDDVLEAARFTNANPVAVKQVLEKISEGDLAGAKADVEAWYRQHAIQVTVELAQSSLDKIRQALNKLPGINLSPGAFGSTSSGLTSAPAAAPLAATTFARTAATTVNVQLPRGARHGDIARAMGMSTRRNGRRYGNPSGTVSYARR